MLVEHRSWEQPLSIFEGDHLTAVEMPREHQVVSLLARSCPDGWVMCAQNSNITFGDGNRIRTGNRNDPRTMRDANRGLVNPFASAANHCDRYSSPSSVYTASQPCGRDALSLRRVIAYRVVGL